MVEYAESTPGGEDRTAAIIALEKHALELWNDGTPDGFIALSSDDVVYMDPALEHKLVGKEALVAYYDPIRGKVKIPEYRMIDPVVQSVPDAAVQTYDYEVHRHGSAFKMHWTEVYRLNPSGRWEIIHTHWSFFQPAR